MITTVVAGGYAPNGPSEFFLARYTTSGTLDGSFEPASGTPSATAPAGVVFTAFDPASNAGAASLVQLPDGTFVAGGSAGTSFALARYWGDNSPPAYALATADAVYVNLLYQQLLGRPVDQPGLSGWVTWLAQGAGRSQVALGIEQSPEYRTRLVDSFYTTLLGRPADPAGQAGFVSALGAGMTVEQVQAIILGSAEYAQRAGGSDTAFLQAVYHDVLGRPLDSASAAGWSTALAQLDHAGVAALILASPEAEADRIQAAYQRYLHRPADPPGLASWLLQLQHGLSDPSLAANILGSTEFFSRM